MMRPVIACVPLRKLSCLQRPYLAATATGLKCPPRVPSTDKCNSYYRFQSSKGGVNGDSSLGNDIVESTAATTQWKRSHYRKITDKFQPPSEEEDKANTNNQAENDDNANTTTNASSKKPEPLNIENYEDVQPMWKEMESRVTRRRSLTLQERGGVSGRRNVRKSDEDMWLEAGVYNDSDKSKK